MAELNIFQGSKSLLKAVAETLEYKDWTEHGWFTEDIFLSTFFYMSKRFGPGMLFDDYKQAGVWDFKVKKYTIRVEMNSSWVIFMMFGDKKIFRRSTLPVYWVKKNRMAAKHSDVLIDIHKPAEKRNKCENEKLTEILNEFQAENNIPNEISQEEFQEKWASDFWLKKVEQYNNDIIGVDFEDYKRYSEYMFAEKKHALRTLRQFLNNMLVPILVRDCAYNIKGRISDKEAIKYNRFYGNIKIEFDNKTII